MRTLLLLLALLLPTALTLAQTEDPKLIKIGVIGLDTSHAPAFAKLFNSADAKGDLAGFKVVAAYPNGSPDIVSSKSRIPQYTKEFQDLGIEITDSIPALLEKVDAVLLETNDGRPHLAQALEVFKAGKICFIDKPISGDLTDAVAIFQAAEHFKVPVFSSSSLRFSKGVQEIRSGAHGKVQGCDAYSPCPTEPTHPDLFWYGIHGVETLFTAMGTGCESVVRVNTPGADVVVGTWVDGRIGTFRGIRKGASGYGGQAVCDKGIVQVGKHDGYEPLLVEVAKFFRTKTPPVSAEETLEIYAFMQAAQLSKERKAPVTLKEVLDDAKAKAPQRWKK
jgi:predicted dehydrogenase